MRLGVAGIHTFQASWLRSTSRLSSESRKKMLTAHWLRFFTNCARALMSRECLIQPICHSCERLSRYDGEQRNAFEPRWFRVAPLISIFFLLILLIAPLRCGPILKLLINKARNVIAVVGETSGQRWFEYGDLSENSTKQPQITSHEAIRTFESVDAVFRC